MPNGIDSRLQQNIEKSQKKYTELQKVLGNHVNIKENLADGKMSEDL